MAVFFPVTHAGPGTVVVNGKATIHPDGTESAWSIMARLQRAANITGTDPFTLEVNETSKVLTLASASTFALTITALTYTGFVTAGLATSHASAARTTAQVVSGLTVPSRPFSFAGGLATSTSDGIGGGLFERGTMTILCSDTYVVLSQLARNLRGGTWDVVQDGQWQARIRVTGCLLRPQGRGQTNVTLEVTGKVVA